MKRERVSHNSYGGALSSWFASPLYFAALASPSEPALAAEFVAARSAFLCRRPAPGQPERATAIAPAGRHRAVGFGPSPAPVSPMNDAGERGAKRQT